MNRTSTTKALAASLLFGALSACSVAVPEPSPTTLDGQMEAAAEAASVPADLLKAISYVETRWDAADAVEHDDTPMRYGVMGLEAERLERGAALIGRSVEAIKADTRLQLAAAAAILAEAGRTSGATEGALLSWQSAVGELSGIVDPDARKVYVEAVYGVLRSGASETAESGELIASIPAYDLPEVRLGLINIAAPDYASAVWRPAPSYSAGRAGQPVSLVVVHSCEGGYAGCVSTLRQPNSVSAHYVVNEAGTEVSQLVRESDRAFHVKAAYRCSLNDNVLCSKNGLGTNTISVGIEHGGKASQRTWPAAQIEASAKLACDITRDHGIVRDRNHIVSHGRLQPETRTDPGPNWPWAQYIERIRANCGDGGGGGGGAGIIVDSNNANNDAAKARIELTGTWTSSTSTAGYYGSGYWFANTEAVTAPATFWFYLPTAGTHSVDAWWTGGANRAASAPFVAFNAAGTEVGRTTADQRSGGGGWNQLGTWAFTAGWNKVVLSRWTTAGAVVIADAIRVR